MEDVNISINSDIKRPQAVPNILSISPDRPRKGHDLCLASSAPSWSQQLKNGWSSTAETNFEVWKIVTLFVK